MMPAERAGIEIHKDKEGIPILSFSPKPKGQKICTFFLDVQVIEVNTSGVRLQETIAGTIGRVHTFRPNHEQLKLMTPYLWTHLKMEVILLLPDAE